MSFSSIFSNPRYSQISVLSLLLLVGVFSERIGISWVQPVVIFITAWSFQYLCCRLVKLPFDWRSPAITALSLTLLLRADTWGWFVLAAIVAIGSKFLIRVNGKHLFNPANIAIVLLLLSGDSTWVSPGQWGSYLWLFLLLCCLAQLVLHKAMRSVLGAGFLLLYVGLLMGRALWLGDPLEIPFHQMQNGALLIFAFFMISDPKSTPDSKVAQGLFALLTAVLAFYFHFQLYNFNGLFYALALASLTTPLWDKYLPAMRYQWPDKKKVTSC